MISTMNLLWIIPLSAMAGGFVIVVLLADAFLRSQKVRKRDDNAASDPSDQKPQE